MSAQAFPANFIHIDFRTQYEAIKAQLFALAADYVHRDEAIPAYGEYCKPSTQLYFINEFTHTLDEETDKRLFACLQYIDYVWRIVPMVITTNSGNVTSIINTRMFDRFEITYNTSAIGYMPKGQNDWNNFYRTCLSESAFRHQVKKAAKMIYLYFIVQKAIVANNFEIVSDMTNYVIGAVNYAIHVMHELNNVSEITGMIGYIWTLTTFYNGFKTEFQADDPETTVIPAGHRFMFPRVLTHVDELADVSEVVLKLTLDAIDYEINGPDDVRLVTTSEVPEFEFLKHAHMFPKCATTVEHEDKIVFYNPVEINLDPTKALVYVIHKLRQEIPKNDFMNIMRILDSLDSFEEQYIKRDAVPNTVNTAVSYASNDEVATFINTVAIPENTDLEKLYFVCYVRGTGLMLFQKNADGRISTIEPLSFNLTNNVNGTQQNVTQHSYRDAPRTPYVQPSNRGGRGRGRGRGRGGQQRSNDDDYYNY